MKGIIPYFRKKGIIAAYTMLAVMWFLFTGCHHKDLDDEPISSTEIEIVFDWSLAPDADPASMGVAFFSDGAQAVRFDFTGRQGGTVRMPAGNYIGLAFNSDDEDWVRLREVDDIDAVEIHTRESSVLRASGISVRGLPRSGDYDEEESESMVETPRMFWTDREDNMVLTGKEERKQLVFTPEEGVCHYNVTVRNVSHIENMGGLLVDATLSGMSGGYLEGRGRATDSRVTFPFLLNADMKAAELTGTLLTFGENPERDLPHKLTVYLILRDGSKRYYVYDVADQIRNAPDPRHVDIVVSGLDIPQPVAGGGGFQPDVKDWETENRDLQM